jgi:hypothetical protein
MKYTLKQWQELYKNPKDLIVQASSITHDDSWQEHPIGMSYCYMDLYDLGEQLQMGDHNLTVHCGIRKDTDAFRRRNHPVTRSSVIDILEKNNITNNCTSSEEYFISLPKYKFVISPEGNGIDCHRHYEALIAGCIPIMESNPLTIRKYKNLPVLYTKDYSEISREYLESIYESFLNTTYYFSSLFLNYYSTEQIKLIQNQSEYWCQFLTKRSFY